MANVLTEQQAQALSERALRLINADGAQVRVVSRDAGHLRVGANQITTGGTHADVTVELTARLGSREATVQVNQSTQDELARAAARAVDAARLAPENPELMPFPTPEPAPAVQAEFASTANLDADSRVRTATAIIERAEAVDMVGAAFFTHDVTSTAVANTAGLFRYHRASRAALSTTMRTADGRGSGWAGSTHNDADRLESVAALADRAIGKAAGSQNAQPIAPGRYTVVLERAAVAPLIQRWAAALDARAAAEGRSAMARPDGGSAIGETLAADGLTVVSDPTDAEVLGRPFTDDGVPLHRTVWLRNGILEHLSATRYWAAQHGMDPLPYDGDLIVTGTEQSLESLVATVERGLLVTRLWYIREVDRRTLTVTGLTRDGTFLIENGRIVRGVANLRFNQSIVALLRQVRAVGPSERTLATGSGDAGPAIVVPPLVVSDFQFTSASDAV
jgi:predicted Zn-dependent protease